MYDENNFLSDDDLSNYNLKKLVSPIIKFLKKHTCYDIMPSSTKVIVFDIDAKVKEAFKVAVESSKFSSNIYM